MVLVRRKENETSSALIKRFTKAVHQSGVILAAKKKQFRERPKSRLKKKIEALKRIKRQKRIEYLKKLGKID